jgi:hypothetical protein
MPSETLELQFFRVQGCSLADFSNTYQLYLVAAVSKADAQRLLERVTGFPADSWKSEVNHANNQGWGNQEKMIEPQRGVWGANSKKEKPVKLL